jgi:predicted transcriptional regulator of viral defense system
VYVLGYTSYRKTYTGTNETKGVTLRTSTSRFLARYPVFRLEEFREAFGRGTSDETVRTRIKQFLASGRLRLISPGVYAVTPPGEDAKAFVPDPPLVASRLSRDSVVAYHSAFEALGYANQVFSRTTYLTAGHRRERRLGAQTFVPVAPPKRLGGRWRELATETVHRQGLAFTTTGRERSLVDCLHRPDHSGGLEELLACAGALPSVDLGLLVEYLLALRSPTVVARTGFLLQRFSDRWLLADGWEERLTPYLPRSPAYLLRRESGNVLVRRWQLLVPPSLLEEESPLR